MPQSPLRERLERRLMEEPRPTTFSTDHDPVLADVLRAATHLGDWFEPSTIEAMTGHSELTILLALQRGVDRGLRVEEAPPRLRVRMVSSRPVLRTLAARWAPPPSSPADAPTDDAVEHLHREATAARSAFARGDVHTALTRAAAALAELDTREEPEARDLTLRLLADCAIYISRSGDPMALQRALGTVQRAHDALREEDPVDLRVQVEMALAHVAAEEGSDSSLDAAIDALTSAARGLSDAGRAVESARLLNDLAEVWMRRGDPVRATHLLRSSRSAFASQAASDPSAALELAQTEHLLARLPFHATARPGTGQELWDAAMLHARAARRGYQVLGLRREEARALSTLGMIQTERGDPKALQTLESALALHEQAGDTVGLAKTTFAIGALHRREGRPLDALSALEQSVAHNLHTGSPGGVRKCWSELQALESILPAEATGRLTALRRRVEALAGLMG